MKSEKVNRFGKFTALLVSLSLLLGGGIPVAHAASVENAAGYFNTGLDNIEEWVKKTGLPQLKWKTYKDHGLLIKPFFKFRYDLDSNVFDAPDTDSDHTDSMWSFIPGFQALYKTKYGVIGAAYEATFRVFSQFADQNEQDQDMLIFANLFPAENIYVRTSEKLSQKGATAGNTGFDTIDILDNTFNITFGYVADENWTHEVGYQIFDRDFQSSIAKRYSYTEHIYDYRLYRKVDENVRVYTGTRLGMVSFGKLSSRDTFYYEFPVGIEGKILYGITVNASVGLHHRNLEEQTRNNVTHIVANLSAQKSFNKDKTSIEGGFLRRDVESSFATATTYDEKLWYTSLKHLITPKLRSRLNMYVGNRDFEERVFTGTLVVVGGRVFATPPTQVKRSDDVFGFNFGFDYNVRKWLIFHIDYQYNRRDSNLSALDFTENVFSLGTTIPL